MEVGPVSYPKLAETLLYCTSYHLTGLLQQLGND